MMLAAAAQTVPTGGWVVFIVVMALVALGGVIGGALRHRDTLRTQQAQPAAEPRPGDASH